MEWSGYSCSRLADTIADSNPVEVLFPASESSNPMAPTDRFQQLSQANSFSQMAAIDAQRLPAIAMKVLLSEPKAITVTPIL